MRPADTGWSSSIPYEAEGFGDDSTFADPMIGHRMGECAEKWGWWRILILTEKSINVDQLKLEGAWRREHTIHTMIGFVISTVDFSISWPPRNSLGSIIYIRSGIYNPGSVQMRIMDTQTISGLARHWLVPFFFWRTILQVMDSTQQHTSESEEYVSFPDPELRRAMWRFLTLLRDIDGKKTSWPRCFTQVLPRRWIFGKDCLARERNEVC